MEVVFGKDVEQIEYSNNIVIVYMKNGDTLEFYSDTEFHVHKYESMLTLAEKFNSEEG